jgi:hypothetical protein
LPWDPNDAANAGRWAKRCAAEGLGLGKAPPPNVDMTIHTRCVAAQLKTQRMITVTPKRETAGK